MLRPAHLARSTARVSTSLAIVGLVLLAAAGCGPGVRAFRAPGPGLAPGTTIAFLPLTNLTEHESAGRLVTDRLLVELGRTRRFTVQDPGIVIGELRRLRILTPDRMSSTQMADLALATGASHFLTGTVTLYREADSTPGSFPAAAFTLRLIDGTSATVLWAVSLARTGDDRETVFGLGRVRTGDRLVSDMAGEAVASMDALLEPGRPLIAVGKQREDAR